MQFNEDKFLAEKFLAIRDAHNIDTVIETGTYHADTTQWLAQNFKQVHTCEVMEEYFKIGQEKLASYTNVNHQLMDSRSFLKSVLPDTNDATLLIFLDAHWWENPLIGELKAIADSEKKPIIAIHDFHVPGKDFGYDIYPGIAYTWEYIEAAVEGI